MSLSVLKARKAKTTVPAPAKSLHAVLNRVEGHTSVSVREKGWDSSRACTRNLFPPEVALTLKSMAFAHRYH